MSTAIKAHLALFTANLIYGANFIIAKGVMPNYLSPSLFVLVRVIGAGVLFWLAKSLIKEKVERKDLFLLSLCGLFGVAINQSLFFKGLSLTSPLNSAIIMVTTPILVAVLSVLVLKEKFGPVKITGFALGLIGAVSLILLSKTSASNSTANALGDLFILMNAISYALYLVLVKPLMKKYHFITIISWVFLFGFIFIAPLGLYELKSFSFNLPTNIIYSILYVVVATTFLAYMLNILALRTLPPSVTSSYIYLQPFFSGVFIWLHTIIFEDSNYTNELSFSKVICGILICIGVYLISKRKKITV